MSRMMFMVSLVGMLVKNDSTSKLVGFGVEYCELVYEVVGVGEHHLFVDDRFEYLVEIFSESIVVCLDCRDDRSDGCSLLMDLR